MSDSDVLISVLCWQFHFFVFQQDISGCVTPCRAGLGHFFRPGVSHLTRPPLLCPPRQVHAYTWARVPMRAWVPTRVCAPARTILYMFLANWKKKYSLWYKHSSHCTLTLMSYGHFFRTALSCGGVDPATIFKEKFKIDCRFHVFF